MTGPGGPEVLVLGSAEEPAPGPGEVQIEVLAAGVNRADVLQRQGNYAVPPGASPILGLECSGRISALGDNVTGWTVGQQCCALLAGGGYAERVVVPVGQVLPIPDGIDPVAAAGLPEVAATVVSNLDLAGLQAEQWLAVHGGAGGIGSFAIQYAVALGARVLATAGSPQKLDYCRSLGATAAIDYHDDWPARLAEITEGHGADVILDVVGAKYLPDNVAALAVDGRLVVIGLQGGRSGTRDLGRLLAKRGAVFATALRSRPLDQKAAICARVRETVWPLIAAGRIGLGRQSRFAFADAAEAHRHFDSGENIGKILLVR